MSTAPAWFDEEIRRGLSYLVVLHLPGSPGHETIGATRQAWVETLWSAPIGWDVELDSNRMQAAFSRLARECDRWPAPRRLLELLPERPTQPRLARPTMTDAQRQRNRARLDEMMRDLGMRPRREQ